MTASRSPSPDSGPRFRTTSMTSGARPTATASISCSDHSKGASCSRAVMRMASSRSGRPTGESQRAFTPVPAPRIAAAAAEGPPAGSGAGMASRLRDSGSTSAGSEVPVCAPALTGTSSTARQKAAADIRMIGSLVDACIGSTPVSPRRKSPLHSSGEVPAVSTADATRHRPADAGARAFLVSASIQGRPAGARPGASDLGPGAGIQAGGGAGSAAPLPGGLSSADSDQCGSRDCRGGAGLRSR